MTYKDLRDFLLRFTSNNFDIYVGDTPVDINMLEVKDGKLIIGKNDMLYSEYHYTVSLIEAAQSYAKECSGEFNPDIRDAFIHGAEWAIKQIKDGKYYL